MAFEPLGITAVAQNVGGFVRSLATMENAIKAVGKSADVLGKDFARVGDTVLKTTAAMATAAIAGVGALGAAIAKVTIDAAPLEGQLDKLDRTLVRTGQDTQEFLAEMKTASLGMLSMRDSINLTNLAADQLGDNIAGQLPDQLENLGKAAASQGISMAEATELYISAVASGSDAAARQLGIIVDSGKVLDNYAKNFTKSVGELTAAEANKALREFAESIDKTVKELSEGEQKRALKEYAKQVNKTGKDLTTAQKKTAFYIAVNQQLAREYGKLDSVAGNFTTTLQVVSAMFQDLKDEIGLATLPAMKDLFASFVRIASFALPRIIELYKEKFVPALEEAAGVVKEFIDVLLGTGDKVDQLRTIVLGVLDNLIPDDLHDEFNEVSGFIERHVRRIRDFLEENATDIKTFFLNLAKILGGAALVRSFTLIGRLIWGALGPIGVLFAIASLLLTAWQNNWGGIQEKTEEVIGVITEKINFLKDEFNRVFGPIIEEWLPKLEDAWFEIKRVAVDDVIPALTQAWKDFGPAFEDLKTTIADEVVPALLNAWEQLGPIWETIKTTIVDTVIPALRDAFTELAGYWENIAGPGEDFISGLMEGLQGLADDIGPVIEDIAGFLEETLGPTFLELKEQIFGILESLSLLIGDELSKLAELWDEHGAGILRAVGTAIKFILLIAQNLMLFLATIFNVGLKILRGDWEGAWDALASFIPRFIDNVLSFLDTDFQTAFIDSWTGIFENIEIIIEHFVGVFVNYFADLGDRIKATVTGFLDDIWQSFKDWSNNIGDLLFDAIGKPFNDAVDAILGLLGIQSPSKFMEGVGKEMVAGLQAGLEEVPAMNVAVNAGPASGAGGTTQNFNMTINTAAPKEAIAQDFQMMQSLASRRR